MPLLDPFSAVTASLAKAKIIPDVIGSFRPTAFLSILLPSGPATLGAEVPLSETVEPPRIVIAAAPSDADIGEEGLVKNQTRYTLAMFDPDAPSAAQPTSSQFRHWVITGLTPTDDPAAPALQPTPAANAYRPPGPPKGSGIHRYTFVLFREPPNFSLPEGASELDPSIEARRRWDAVKFGERNGLQMVGAAFYLVRGEE
ncbi:phosphatidylethanolamine-binding protein [Mycena rosella]|uniref:Phosphatidylethanolamine-binding protein n=1 Tax=Mycena rosella TaxID=1033263 RepID=A0AAD7DHF5_MYCRO|nr:phosphatidylethanolamine-binding protein [Mycena rosella]